MIKLPDFGPEFFSGNRRRLLAALPGDTVVAIVANGALQRGGDVAYPFVQDANFFYLTGINDPDIILVIDGNREFLIVPVREGIMVTFDGQIDPSKLAASAGITDVENEVAGWKRLDAIIGRKRRVATLLPTGPFIEQYQMYANPARARFCDRLQHHSPELELVDIRPELARLRMVKQPVEIDAITAAIDITVAALKDVYNKPLSSYKYEYEIEADLFRGFRYRGALGQAFEPIVAGGRRACTIHYLANSEPLAEHELVVIDVGANVGGYAADVSRTYAVGAPTRRQKQVFAAVRTAQAYAFSLLKPGVSFRDYEKQMECFVGEQLKQLGVINNLKRETIRRHFPHATSHFLGLNAHDAGDYRRPLEAGVVLAVEPGIYLPKEGIGVRLEDDVLITDDGMRVLGSALPARL